MITLILAKTKCMVKKKKLKESVENVQKDSDQNAPNSANVKKEESDLGKEYIVSLQYEYE